MDWLIEMLEKDLMRMIFVVVVGKNRLIDLRDEKFLRLIDSSRR